MPPSRVHVVLVPGFAGFDALGQVEYYAGITPLFRRWKAAHADERAVLHYFDNLPTAGVETRASRLRGWLAKRVARGVFQPGDALALVGHSTAGLDIRRLLWDLAHVQDPIAVDGARGEAMTVDPAAILGLLGRVAFLSVPQWGTNIADWVRAHPIERALAIAGMRAMLRAAAGLPAYDTFQGWVTGHAATLAGADLLLAIQDALSEIDVQPNDDAARVAAAHEAAAELGLWLRHVSTDFGALDDLASDPPPRSRSPAHFGAKMRAREREVWREFGIRTRSWATVGRRPYQFDPGAAAARWDLSKPWTWPDFTTVADATGTDVAYRWVYRACAGGPFQWPGGTAPTATPLGATKPWTIERWDNDGIVNTASMFWPDGAETVLVAGDHGDVLGHFRTLEARPGSGRQFHTYDLLGSNSGFTERTLEQVWNGVFDFCAAS